MERFLMLLLIISAIVCGITYLIYRFTSKQKFVKYLPGALFVALAGYNFYVVRQPHMGFEGIALALLMVIFIWIALVNFVTGVYIDYIYPLVKKRK